MGTECKMHRVRLQADQEAILERFRSRVFLGLYLPARSLPVAASRAPHIVLAANGNEYLPARSLPVAASRAPHIALAANGNERVISASRNCASGKIAANGPACPCLPVGRAC